MPRVEIPGAAIMHEGNTQDNGGPRTIESEMSTPVISDELLELIRDPFAVLPENKE